MGDSAFCMDYSGYFPAEASINCEASIVGTETGVGTGFQPTIEKCM